MDVHMGTTAKGVTAAMMIVKVMIAVVEVIHREEEGRIVEEEEEKTVEEEEDLEGGAETELCTVLSCGTSHLAIFYY